MGHDRGITLVTLSASYGAGGSHVGPALARRLDVPFVARAVSAAIADALVISHTAAERLDEDVERGIDRVLAHMAPIGEFYGDVDPELLQRSSHHEAAEQVIREVARTGRGVILGRAGAVVLADHPQALHVRLDRPPAGAGRPPRGAAGGACPTGDAPERRRRGDRRAPPPQDRPGARG